TSPQFIVALNAKKPSRSGYAVKVRFTDGAKAEHMWISKVTFAGDKFHGTLDNMPGTVTNVKLGQVVSISKSEIGDWMYIENGKLVGGYTLRAIRNMKTPAERAEMDKQIPFVIDEK